MSVKVKDSVPPFSHWPIICLSSQEWEAPLPTNRQRIMQHAADRNHRILFVETGGWIIRYVIGRCGRATSLSRRRRWTRLVAAEEVQSRVCVHKAWNLLPWAQRYSICGRVNGRIDAAVIRIISRRLRLGPRRVTWIYDPCAVALAKGLRAKATVYDCVDDYAEQVGTDPKRRRVVARADAASASLADAVFCTTEELAARQLVINPNTSYVPNVADQDHFKRGIGTTPPSDYRDLAGPVIGFAGNLTALKVDFDLITAVATARPLWTLLLVGPVSADAQKPVDRLTQFSNVTHLGPVPYELLPAYVAHFDVAVIPYNSNSYTANCFPLKLYEYLASGRPVVVTGLPSVPDLCPDVLRADGSDEFICAVEAQLTKNTRDDLIRRVASVSGHTWDDRARRLLEITSALV